MCTVSEEGEIPCNGDATQRHSKADGYLIKGGKTMPNQKSRKKKDGTNKNKKLQAMREKERRAKPRGKPSATGQGIGEQLKDQTVQDRPGHMSRA